MNKQELFSWVRLLLAPVLVCLLGLILIVNPDSASVLIAKLLGWAMALGGIVIGLSAIFTGWNQKTRGIAAVALVLVGGWLSANPLVLAAWAGRLVGVLLVLNGVQDILRARAEGSRFVMPVIVTGIGVALILMPMSASRLVFTLCGVAVLCVGCAMVLDRLWGRKRLREPEDPNIIDAL